MHRTQILLEDHQYRAIRQRAQREGKSMGELIRQFVQSGLSTARGAKQDDIRLDDLQGLFCDERLQGCDHDRHLYGKP